jgi:hypothetical protein
VLMRGLSAYTAFTDHMFQGPRFRRSVSKKRGSL